MSANQGFAIRNGPIGTWELDLVAHQLTCSSGFKQLLGLATEVPLPFSRLATLLHAEDWTRLTSAIARCIETQSDLHIEVRIPGIGENARWIELRAELRSADDGTAVRLTGISLDATQRLKAQEEMHRTALLLRAVLETASGLIYAKDRDGRMLIANPPTLELIGRSWQEVEGRTDVEFLENREQGLAVMANDRRIMDSGRTEVLEERVGSDHDIRTWLSTKSPLRDEAGQIIGLVGLSQDITARKAAEQKLLDLNETLEARVAERTQERDRAWNTSQDLLLVLDGAGIFRAVNPAWTTVLGWGRDELLEHNILEFIHPDDHSGSIGALARAGSALVSNTRTATAIKTANTVGSNGAPHPQAIGYTRAAVTSPPRRKPNSRWQKRRHSSK